MNRQFTIKQIGVIHTPFQDQKGAPIQPRGAKGVKGKVEVFPQYTAGLKDLDGFERIWLLYWFDRCKMEKLTITPFLDKTPRGLFATRAPCRPNPIGLSSVRLLSIKGNIIEIEDVDVLNGTPLLDIKPYVERFDVFDVKRMGWLSGKGPENVRADRRFSG